MAPSPPRIMPIALQITSLQRIFRNLNPELGIDIIDWEMQTDKTLTMPENRINLSIIYPQYIWFADETEMKGVKRQALDDLRDMLDYMLSVVPPEAQEDFREVFDDYLSRATYSLERKLKLAPLKREIEDLRTQLEQAKKRKEPTPGLPPRPRPLTWTSNIERKLRDIFEATFTRAGMSPRRYMAEYRLELPVIKTLLTQDDMVRAVEELAKEIIARERAIKIKPPAIRPPAPPRPPIERIIGLPPEEAEEFYVPFIYPPMAMSEMRFPRRPAGIEVDQIFAKFENDLLACGIAVPATYRSTFEIWENHTYDSWKQMRDIYDLLVEKICKGQRFTAKDLPVRIPYEAICEGVYWLVSQKWAESVEDIVRKLDELGTPATRETVKDCIRQGWREKVPNFVIVTKDYLEHLLAEPLELEIE